MESTISATAIWGTDFLRYVISPAFVMIFVGLVIDRIFRLGMMRNEFKVALEDIRDLKDESKQLLRSVDIIKTHLISSAGMKADLFAAHSPVVLKSKGRDLLERSGFPRIYQKNQKWFVQKIKDYEPQSLSDVDDACVSLLEKMKNKNSAKLSGFKEFAFENGVTLEVLLRVFAIFLRDEVAREVLKK